MREICTSVFFLQGNTTGISTSLRLYTEIVRPYESVDYDELSTDIEWQTLFAIMQSIPALRSGMEKIAQTQQQIDKNRAASEALRPLVDSLGQYGIQLSNKLYFEYRELQNKLLRQGNEILSGQE